jgi:hypothetical protein
VVETNWRARCHVVGISFRLYKHRFLCNSLVPAFLSVDQTYCPPNATVLDYQKRNRNQRVKNPYFCNFCRLNVEPQRLRGKLKIVNYFQNTYFNLYFKRVEFVFLILRGKTS